MPTTPIAMIGDGKSYGDYRVIGNEMAGFNVERLDPVQNPLIGGGVIPEWSVKGSAAERDAAIRVLEIIYNADLYLFLSSKPEEK